jgi:hypothetical protein
MQKRTKRAAACKNCGKKFMSYLKSKKLGWTEFCSIACAAKHRTLYGIQPKVIVNGSISLEEGVKMIRKLANAGHLTKATLTEALRRESDKKLI